MKEPETVIITGANRGIGLGIAQVLNNTGRKVIALNRTIAKSPWQEILCDVSNYESIHDAIQSLNCPIDAVIANAGIRRFGSIETLSISDWKKSIETNTNGVFYVAKETLPLLRNTQGYFIVIGSHAEQYSFSLGSAYCTSKAGLPQLVNCIIDEERYNGIRAAYLSIGAVKNRDHNGDENWKLTPENIGTVIASLLQMPKNILIPYLDIRPQKPMHPSMKGIDLLQTK